MELIEKKPKVSVCVVTYNQEKYIHQCLQSLIDQVTNFDFEVIVADDCSTDGTRAIVKDFAEKYIGKIKPIFHNKNIGAYKNFVYVHEQANGAYVSHMDGDDYALPGKLQAQANILDNDQVCTAVWHRADYFDDGGGFCSGKTADLSVFANGKVLFADAIKLGFVGVHSSLMYRRSARESVPLDKKILDIYITWDLLSKGHGFILNEVLGRYRVASSGSISVSSSIKLRKLSIEHASYFSKKFPEQRKNYFIWALCKFIVEAKNFRPAAIYFLKYAVFNIRLVKPSEIIYCFLNVRKIQVRWRNR